MANTMQQGFMRDAAGNLGTRESSYATAFNGRDSWTVGLTSVTIMAANPDRRDAQVWCDHATAKVYVALGDTALAGEGGRANGGGGSVPIPLGYTGPVSVISDTASTNVCGWEA